MWVNPVTFPAECFAVFETIFSLPWFWTFLLKRGSNLFFYLLILVGSSHQRLTIQKYLNERLFFWVKSKRELVEAWGNADQAWLVLLPQKVVRTSVDSLHLPRHLVFVVKVTRFPDPPTDTVLGAKRLINKSLFVEWLLQFIISNTFFYLCLNQRESLVHIWHIDFLIE